MAHTPIPYPSWSVALLSSTGRLHHEIIDQVAVEAVLERRAGAGILTGAERREAFRQAAPIMGWKNAQQLLHLSGGEACKASGETPVYADTPIPYLINAGAVAETCESCRHEPATEVIGFRRVPRHRQVPPFAVCASCGQAAADNPRAVRALVPA